MNLLKPNTAIYRWVFSICLVAHGWLVQAQPVIQSFTPLSAAAGSTITLQGSGFSTTPSDHLVYFGPVRGTVTSASATALQVTVPNGAACAPLSITRSGLSGFSSRQFIPVFSPSGNADSTTFPVDTVMATPDGADQLLAADFDGNGRVDFVLMNRTMVQVLKHSGTASAYQYTLQDVALPTSSYDYSEMAVADIDGDGRQDLVINNSAAGVAHVCLNTSSGGQISFAGAVSIPVNLFGDRVTVADLDLDGKPDLLYNNPSTGGFDVRRNQSTTGNVSFASPVNFSSTGNPVMIVAADLNNDRKPEVLLARASYKNLLILQNNSTPGNLSLTITNNIFPDGGVYNVQSFAAGDLDNDGFSDLVVAVASTDNYYGHAWMLRNTSTSGGTPAFATAVRLSAVTNQPLFFYPRLSDINGDGKLDILMARATGNGQFELHQNQTTGSTFSFTKAGTFDFGGYIPMAMAVADVDGDGQQDVLCGQGSTTSLRLYLNRVNKPSIMSVSPATAGEGATVTIRGGRLNGAAVVKFGNLPARSFSPVSSTLLNAVVDTGSTGYITVQTPQGTARWGSFTYNNQPSISSFTPTLANSNDTVVISGANFLRATAVRFGNVAAQWFTIVNASTIRAVPGSGASGAVTVQTPSGTASLNGFNYKLKPVITGFSGSGYPGSTVFIYGQNLGIPGYTTSVTFGGVPATYVIVNGSYTSIQATVGEGASGYVKVSHTGGVDSMAGFTFIPAPKILSFSPAAAYPADTVYIRGTALNGVTKVLFGDSLAVTYTIVGDTLIKAVIGHGRSGNVRVEKNTGISQKAGFSFLPLPPPVITGFSPQHAVSGTTMRIQGQYLWGVLSVKVGNVTTRQFRQIDFNNLDVVTPVAASGAVTVTTYYGTYTLPAPLFTRVLPPVITGFSPRNAEPGQEIRISGSGFGTDPAAVKVMAGPMKATLLSVTDNLIRVQAPMSCGWAPLSVTVNSLTAVSENDFSLVNPSIAYLRLDTSSFERVNPLGPGTNSYECTLIPVDINGDAKPDYVSLAEYGGVYSIINTSVPGKPSWIARGEPGSTYYSSREALTADFDGDGRKDVYFYSYGGIMLNQGTPDSPHVVCTITASSMSPGLADMNGDGKIDVIDKYGGGNIRIFLNNSVPGKLYFNDTLSFFVNFGNSTGYGDLGEAADYNADGLTDLALFDGESVYILPNRGTRAVPVFDTVVQVLWQEELGWLYNPEQVLSADLTGDGLPDLLVRHDNYNTASFAVYRNISSANQIRFGPRQLISNAGVEKNLSVADFNGDGKPDILLNNQGWVFIYENRSTADSIILAEKFGYNRTDGAITASDMDGDNKVDIIGTYYGQPHLLRNRMNEPKETKLCPGATASLWARISGSSYRWQMKPPGGVYADIFDNANFSSTGTDLLQIAGTPSEWLRYEFRCRVGDSVYSEPYTLKFENTWVGGADNNNWATASNWSCGVVPDGYTDVIIPSWKTVNLTTNGSCRSVKAGYSAQLNVAPGVELTVTNR